MDQLVQRILTYNKGRLPEMLSKKYAAMAQDPFRFFRGTNHLFYEDHYQMSLFRNRPATWICGDLHIENFGSYKSDNKLVYFDINDFDEAFLAPFTWDAARMAASIMVACGNMALTEDDAATVCRHFLDSYILTLATGKARHIEKETADGLLGGFLAKVALRKTKDIIKERCNKDATALKTDGVRQLQLPGDKKVLLLQQLNEWLAGNPDNKYHLHALDVAFRVAGTGSLGQERYVFLCTKPDGKPVMIDMKQSINPTGAAWTDTPQPRWKSNAERIAWTQNFMQDEPPALLSAYRYNNKWFLLKALQPMDDKINYALLADNIKAMKALMSDAGVLAASAHLRGTGRKGAATADELMRAAGTAKLHQSLQSVAVHYAAANALYYEQFCAALKSGVLSL